MTENKWSITPDQKRALVAKVTEAREAGSRGRYLQAIATAEVFALDAIGEGRVYRTQGDYADAIGVTNGAVTGLRNLSVAVRLGLTPEHTSWGVVSSKAGNIGAVCRDPKVTLAKITKAAKAAKVEDQKRADAKAAAKAKADAKPTPPDAKAKPGPATERVMALEAATEALETLRSVMATLLPADRTAIRNSLVTLTSEYGAPVAPVAETA